MSIKIMGAKHFLPPIEIDNFRLYKNVKNFDLDRAVLSLSKKGVNADNLSEVEIFNEWVKQVSGIEKRYYINDEIKSSKYGVVETLGYYAARDLIDSLNINKNEIDTIIFASYTFGVSIPSSAITLAHLLGLDGVKGVTINSACSGSLDALGEAYIRIKANEAKNVLVVASEYMSGNLDYSDVTTAILFGDGAAAALVSKVDDETKPGIIAYEAFTNYSPEHIYMEYGKPIEMGGGPNVQKRAVNAMKDILLKALHKADVKISDLDVIIPHQANLRIINQLGKSLKIEDNKLISIIQNVGNLGSASLLTALSYYLNSRSVSKEELIGLTSVGGGYTYSAMIAYI